MSPTNSLKLFLHQCNLIRMLILNTSPMLQFKYIIFPVNKKH